KSATGALARAAQALHTVHMPVHAASALVVRGGLSQAPTRMTEAHAAESWLRRRGVRDPERYARMLMPGFD
ncbi:MAG: hypothetical protein AAGC55_01725, partial [Myxococcota bacterium]